MPCALALAIILSLRPNSEPSYQGKRLSWWVVQYEQNPAGREEAQRAIAQIGTNALPTLLQWINYEEPPWRTKLVDRFDPGGRPPRRITVFLRHVAMGGAGRRARAANEGFMALGTKAHPAIIELATLMGSTRSTFVSRNAMYALANIPGDKVLMVAAGLKSNDSTTRTRAAQCIGFFAEHGSGFEEMDATWALYPLVRALRDADPTVAAAAATSLGKPAFQNYADVTLPALTAALTNANPDVRRSAADSLGLSWEPPPDTLRALERTLSDESLAVRCSATDALHAINQRQPPPKSPSQSDTAQNHKD